jgi:AcrR family transcriptional regulator
VSRKNQNAETRIPEILEGYYRVLIEEGFEGTSIGKIAAYLDIHPSLILHYFKNKDNLQLALIDLLVAKYKSEHMLNFEQLKNHSERLTALMDVIFSYNWSRTVDPGVHFGFYYKSFRDENISATLSDMFRWLRDFLHAEFKLFNQENVIQVRDERKAADFVITLMEGLEFHAHFLGQDRPFEEFAQTAKETALAVLKNGLL